MKLSVKTAVLPTEMVDFYLEKVWEITDRLLAEKADISPSVLNGLISSSTYAAMKTAINKFLPNVIASGFFEDIKNVDTGKGIDWTESTRFLYLFDVLHACILKTIIANVVNGDRDAKPLAERYRSLHELQVASSLETLLKEVPEGARARVLPVMEEVAKVNAGTMLGVTAYNFWKVLDFLINTKDANPRIGAEELLERVVPEFEIIL